MSDADISTAAAKLHEQHAGTSAPTAKAPAAESSGSSFPIVGGLLAALATMGPSGAARGVEQVATSPALSKVAGYLGGKFTNPAIGAIEGYQLLTGKKGLYDTAVDTGKDYVYSKIPGLLQQLALKAAPYARSAATAVDSGLGALASSAGAGMSGALGMVLTPEQQVQMQREMLMRQMSSKDPS
jgi:hypothetical protein